jgi:predicted nicotinamide N-methyase
VVVIVARIAAVKYGSEYDGPVVVTSHVFGSHMIQLVRPADPERLLDDPRVLEWSRRDDYMPYWAYLWPAAYLLADAVARECWPDPQGRSRPLEALEIGCGLGLGGLVALARGLRVQFSDYDQGPLDFVARSVAANGFDRNRAVIRRLDWRDLPDEHFPIIIAADVIYEARLVPMVAALLARMLLPGGSALIASPLRVAAESFPAEVSAHGLTCRAARAAVRSEDGQLLEGIIYRIQKE